MPEVIDSRTRIRILQAALHHIALFGEDRLSMSGVAAEAGLSRGTVYRYFTNREELLVALAEHVRSTFQNGVDNAAKGGGESKVKLKRIIEQRIDGETRQAVRRLRELQPAFTLNFLAVHMPDFVTVYERALADDFDRGDLLMSLHDFAQIVSRVTVTETLFDDDPDLIMDLVLKLWDAIQPRGVARSRPRPRARPATRTAARSA
jgi:AcrR family transcriptional regulator